MSNAQYSRRECSEVVGIPTSIPNDSLETNISRVFDKLGVNVEGNDIQACHCLKDNDKVIIKFSNRKDSLQVLRVKKDLKSLDPTELDFPEGKRIFINENLCTYYCGLWNKCKKLKGMGKLHVSLYQMVHLKSRYWKMKKMFPDIDVDNL